MAAELEDYKDYELAQLVVWANKAGFQIPITIVVSGAVMTGMLIGVAKYYELFAETMHNAFLAVDQNSADYLRGHYQELGKKVKLELSKELGLDSLENTGFIHLDNASIISGSSINPEPGILFRCRLNQISGFSYGKIGRAK